MSDQDRDDWDANGARLSTGDLRVSDQAAMTVRNRLKDTNAKGGVLGRKLELTVVDDKSENATAIAIYERPITQDKVDLVFSPYSTPMERCP